MIHHLSMSISLPLSPSLTLREHQSCLGQYNIVLFILDSYFDSDTLKMLLTSLIRQAT